MLPPTLEFALWDPGDLGYDADNLFRNRFARYFLPSVDEWYKAAYFDPATDAWYDYPTGSNVPPTAVAGGTDPGTAVYLQDLSVGPADVMNAGGLSPYGTMAQGRNVQEWQESVFDLTNNSAVGGRFRRGGSWDASAFSLSTSAVAQSNPDITHSSLGFRVASVPEPSSVMLVAIASLVSILSRCVPLAPPVFSQGV